MNKKYVTTGQIIIRIIVVIAVLLFIAWLQDCYIK